MLRGLILAGAIAMASLGYIGLAWVMLCLAWAVSIVRIQA
jgi:hypothetical protein